MSPRRLAILAIAFSLCSVAFAQDSTTSTPEERAHWVEVLHSLEAQPTNPANVSAGEAVFKRLIEVKDFHMTICPVITELPKKYSQIQPITQLFTLGCTPCTAFSRVTPPSCKSTQKRTIKSWTNWQEWTRMASYRS